MNRMMLSPKKVLSDDELRTLADALDRIARTHAIIAPDESETQHRAADYLRRCADAQPVAWMRPDNRVREESFTGTQFSRGEQRPPIGTWNPLYAHPAPAAPQAEPIDPHMIVADDRFPDAQAEPKREPNPDEVICPACTHQFRAIPENVQAQLWAKREPLSEATALIEWPESAKWKNRAAPEGIERSCMGEPKRGPLSDERIAEEATNRQMTAACEDAFYDGVRWAEHSHEIGGSMTDAQEALRQVREALAAGPTPGEWSLKTVPTSDGSCHKIGPFPSASRAHSETHACVYASGIRLGIDDSTPVARELLANARLMAACSPANIAAIIAHVEAQAAEIKRLRKMLAHLYAGSDLYCDDGELQDARAEPFIDFKRDSVAEIRCAMVERNERKEQR